MSVNAFKLGFASSRLRRTTVHLQLVLTLLLIILLSYSLWRAKAASGGSLEAPALNGAAAIEYLKGQGLYSGLAAAVRESRLGEAANDDPYCGYVARQWFSASDGAKGDSFGSAVAIDGDTIVVGVPGDTLGPVEFQGTAYVFVRNGEQWNERARLFPSDGAADDSFGYSVAISGDYIVVGAPRNNIGAVNNQGAAYVYFNNGGSWFEQQRLLANDGAAIDSFGTAVAISGEHVAVGAPFADINGRGEPGRSLSFPALRHGLDARG